ncbi:Peptidase S28 [Dillenia turbinata]|uniref:Peptidase S28 n=1 Tax=Dillenia turbinata TaxID=194707 RepID=A0AAN8W9Y2_9MAGN
MRIGSIIVWCTLFSLCNVPSLLAKFTPQFPSSVIGPEKITKISSQNQPLYETKYFTQILDHFNYNPQSYQTFQNRYLINDKYWGGAAKNSPIFVYTGNEGDIEWFAQNTGFMFETAPHFEALLVFIEHRFYGKSIPYGGDTSIAYKNASTLGYLSSTQALADYATLIIDLKKNLSAVDSPVVVFGGSYGGSTFFMFPLFALLLAGHFQMLAAWFRLKYPHVAIGALASSSPILNFEDITSPYSFNNIITQDFRANTAKQPKGLELLRNSFKICTNYISASYLQGWLQTALIYTAMTDYPTPSNFLQPLPAYPVKEMCKAIDNPSLGNDTFAKLYGAANIYYNYTGNATCFDLLDKSDPHGLGEWTWQACTEMIMPTEGSNSESIFPPSDYNYTDRLEFCMSYFDVEPRPTWITTEFGGHDIYRVLKRFGSNIIFFNGLRDPWSGGGYSLSLSLSLSLTHTQNLV